MTLLRVYPVDGILGKLCPRCELWKPLAEWGLSARNRDGLQYYCKTCLAERRADPIKADQARRRAHEWYVNNRERRLDDERARRIAQLANPDLYRPRVGYHPPYTARTSTHAPSYVDGVLGKVCANCEEWKPSDAFGPAHGGRTLQSWCKQCKRLSDSARKRNRKNVPKRGARQASPPPKTQRELEREYLAHVNDATERALAYERDWEQRSKSSDPVAYKARTARKNHRRRSIPGKHTAQDIIDLFIRQEAQCSYCGASIVDAFHIEHKVPVSRGGTNNPDNLCLSCPSCNLHKSAKTDDEFRALLALRPIS